MSGATSVDPGTILTLTERAQQEIRSIFERDAGSARGNRAEDLTGNAGLIPQVELVIFLNIDDEERRRFVGR